MNLALALPKNMSATTNETQVGTTLFDISTDLKEWKLYDKCRIIF